jgi:hypothetical protein
MFTVYFILAVKCNQIKIGSSANPAERLRDLSTACPDEIRCLGTMSNEGHQESKLHEKFRQFRTHGEWFDADQSILEFIDANCSKEPVLKAPYSAINAELDRAQATLKEAVSLWHKTATEIPYCTKETEEKLQCEALRCNGVVEQLEDKLGIKIKSRPIDRVAQEYEKDAKRILYFNKLRNRVENKKEPLSLAGRLLKDAAKVNLTGSALAALIRHAPVCRRRVEKTVILRALSEMQKAFAPLRFDTKNVAQLRKLIDLWTSGKLGVEVRVKPKRLRIPRGSEVAA